MAPRKKYSKDRKSIDNIAGKTEIRLVSKMRIFFNAEMAWVGDINPWILIQYPAIVNNVLLCSGKAAPVKNINIIIGKLPTTKTS